MLPRSLAAAALLLLSPGCGSGLALYPGSGDDGGHPPVGAGDLGHGGDMKRPDAGPPPADLLPAHDGGIDARDGSIVPLNACTRPDLLMPGGPDLALGCDQGRFQCNGRCLPAGSCCAGADCPSGVCSAGAGAAPSCNDGVKNGLETDVDCGSNCNPCHLGRACTQPGDCRSNLCVGDRCAAPTGFTEIRHHKTFVPMAVAVADLDGDGAADFISGDDGSLGVFLGRPGRRFATGVDYPVGGGGGDAIVVGDFTGDGKLDLAAPGGRGVGVLPGNGDGTFRGALEFPTGAIGANRIAGGDFNRDGHPDLAVTNWLVNDAEVLLSDGNGGFRPAAAYPLGGQPVALVAGDLDGDGHDDLAVLLQSTATLQVLLANCDGGFRPGPAVPLDLAPTALVAADLNRDGKLDVAVAYRNNNATTISVLLGNGDGSFAPLVEVPLPFANGTLAAGDFDGDGVVDLAYDANDQIEILPGRGDGRFDQPIQSQGMSGDNLVAGDLDGDGKLDLASTSVQTRLLQIQYGKGDGTFEAPFDPDQDFLDLSLVGAAADFDGDGKMDLVVESGSFGFGGQNGAFDILLGNGDDSFRRLRFPSSAGRGPAVADVNADGKLDLVFSGGKGAAVFLGNGDGTFQAEMDVPAGSEGEVAAGDLNGDGKIDLVVANFSDGTISVLLGNGRVFLNPVAYNVGNHPDALALADLDGDGKLDAIVSNQGDNNVSVLPGKGDGTFMPGFNYAAGRAPGDFVIADFNRDGFRDLAVANDGGHQFTLLPGGAGGGFASSVPHNTGWLDSMRVVTADFNADGKADLAFATYTNVSVVLGNGDGTFQPAQNYEVGIDVASLVAADFDGDKKPDLAIGASNTVVILRNVFP